MSERARRPAGPRPPTTGGGRLPFETLLADLSAAFVNLPTAEVDARIEDALRQVVQFLAVERSSFAEVSEVPEAIRITHSYVRPGYPSFPPSVLDAQLPWFAARIRQGDVVRLERLPDGLPAEAGRERAYCARSGLKSQLTIPLKVGGSVQYAIGCASFRAHRTWDDTLEQRLRLLGQVFANALARRRSDEELRLRERRYRELVESTRAVPWEAEPDTFRTTYVAPQIVSLLGFPCDAWHREGFWASRLHPDDRATVLRGIGDAVRRCGHYEVEYRLVAADGRTVWVHDLVTIPTQGGRPQAVRGVMIDITARKRAEDEASRLRDQLARTARVTVLGEMGAAIAHEVNQPLCAIVSNAETAQDILSGGAIDLDEVRDALRDIVADGRRASDIIRRTREMLQERQPDPAPFDANAAIREVASLLRHQLTRDSVALTLVLAADLPPARGDRVQVQQVILNLLLNAAEAVAIGPAGRRQLSAATARTGDSVTISVGDTGPGIEPDSFDQIFDSFFTTKPGGTGLGLSISRTIVAAHGGRIWAESTPGRGATFHFTLPVAGGQP